MPDPVTPACELCQRSGLKLTRHHLIPRKRHRQRSCQQRFDREERLTRISILCRPCHNTVHATLTEKELEDRFNTIQTLAAHPEIDKFVRWVRKQKTHRKVAIRRPKS